jgi:hypothetical protein
MTCPKHDRLLSALIAKLPAAAGPWPRADRVAWLQMIATAFDVVYGPCGGIRVVPEEMRGDGLSASDGRDIIKDRRIEDRRANAPPHGPAERQAMPQAGDGVAERFYVDRDGFAMGGGRPIAMEDLPAGAILWDERIGIECGDAGAILWRDIGASRRSLPPGVTLRPVFES